MEDIVHLNRTDARYPALLRKLHDAPKELWLRGNLGALALPGIAVVGTRRASPNGLQVARSYSRVFARAGAAVVSGLALGIDAAAHLGAIDENGVTIAVLGSGVDDDSIQPRTNFPIARRLLETNGLLISEDAPGTTPLPWHFPRRNRIIAALARVTVVIEAPQQSGALITAKFALEVGHDVYAVPSDVTRETARGSNKLIAFGAPPLLDPQELVATLFESVPRLAAPGTVRTPPHTPTEEKILAALAVGVLHVDDVTSATHLPAATVHAALAALELRGEVTALGNMQFSRAKS